MTALTNHLRALERSRTAQRIANVVDEVPVALETDAHVKAALLATLPGVLKDIDDGRLSGSPAAEARLSALLGVALEVIAQRRRGS